MQENEKKEPFLRMTARTDYSTYYPWVVRIASVFCAILLGSVIYMILGYDPVSVYKVLFSGSLGTSLSFQQTLRIMIPLLGAAIAIAPAFCMRFWNIGVEGQITMGAVFSTFFALKCADSMPHSLLLLCMLIAGAVGGAVWGIIPALFKAKWNTNETLFTLMLNYIAIGIVKYLQGGPWQGKPGTQQIGKFSENARMPQIGGVTVGIFLILFLTVFMFIYMKYTGHGYQIQVVGQSVNTALYAGINVKRVIVRTMALSGAVSGLVGFVMVSGINFTLSDSVAGGVGFTGITIAWLANLNSFGMVIISLLLAVLERGSSAVATMTGNVLSANMADILTGLILFCMLGSEFFIRYRLIFRKKNVKSEKEEQ